MNDSSLALLTEQLVTAQSRFLNSEKRMEEYRALLLKLSELAVELVKACDAPGVDLEAPSKRIKEFLKGIENA